MLAEPLLDKFCIVFCVSFIVEHRVAIWEEKQHGEEQLVNSNGRVNIGRRLPLGEIRGTGSHQRQPVPPLEHPSLSPALLSSFKFMAIFHSEERALQMSGAGPPFSVLEEQDRSGKSPAK
jgi:hypothetical protein